MRARRNCLIVGDTDAGKTTLLRALLNECPAAERLVTVEDALELQLSADPSRRPHVVELECREPNIEGEGEVTMRDLTRLALRLAPDRVIVGEARGPEILDMFQAMSQGNDGSMGTLHARSSADAFVQIMRYALKAPERTTPEARDPADRYGAAYPRVLGDPLRRLQGLLGHASIRSTYLDTVDVAPGAGRRGHRGMGRRRGRRHRSSGRGGSAVSARPPRPRAGFPATFPVDTEPHGGRIAALAARLDLSFPDGRSYRADLSPLGHRRLMVAFATAITDHTESGGGVTAPASASG